MRIGKIVGPLLIIAFLASSLLASGAPIWAQQGNAGVSAITTFDANLRAGPRRDYPVVASVPAQTPLTVFARSADSAWLLATTPNGRRGWVALQQISFTQSVEVANLPVSEEIISANAPAPGMTSAAPSTGATPIPTSDMAVNIPATYLNAPILPRVDGQMRALAQIIMAKGKLLGNNPAVFSKIGDCMTNYSYFLAPFGTAGQYDLGPYSDLQAVIQHFSAPMRWTTNNSFNIESLASFSGMTSVGLQEPGWAIKGGNLCSKQESMLACDFRVDKPSVAIIMVGFADAELISATDFGPSMRRLVRSSIDAGVIPILSTFPEYIARLKESRIMNNALYEVATEMHVPLINLDAALVNLPYSGVDHNSHLTVPPQVEQSAVFTGANLRYGITVRNLITLQALDIVWRQLMNGG